MLRLSCVSALFLLAGCPSSTNLPVDAAPGTDSPTAMDDAPGGGTDAPGLDAPGGGDDAPASTDAPSSLPDGAPPCSYVEVLDRSCANDGECSVGLHQTDCCGNSVMLGYRTTDYLTYANGESACQASYPACGCPAMPPTTDSGETVIDTAAVQAACVIRGPGRVCLTYVTMRPADGR